MRVSLLLVAVFTVGNSQQFCDDVSTECQNCASFGNCMVDYQFGVQDAMCKVAQNMMQEVLPVIKDALGDVIEQIKPMLDQIPEGMDLSQIMGGGMDMATDLLGDLMGGGDAPVLFFDPSMMMSGMMQCIMGIMPEMLTELGLGKLAGMFGRRRLQFDMEGMGQAMEKLGPIMADGMEMFKNMNVAQPDTCSQDQFDAIDSVVKAGLTAMTGGLDMFAGLMGRRLQEMDIDFAGLADVAGDCFTAIDDMDCALTFVCSNPKAMISKFQQIDTDTKASIVSMGGNFAKVVTADDEIDADALYALTADEKQQLVDAGHMDETAIQAFDYGMSAKIAEDPDFTLASELEGVSSANTSLNPSEEEKQAALEAEAANKSPASFLKPTLAVVLGLLML